MLSRLSVMLHLLTPFLSAGAVSAPKTVPLEQLLSHKSGHQHPIPRDGARYVAVCVEWPPRHPTERVKPLRSGGGHRPPRHRVTLWHISLVVLLKLKIDFVTKYGMCPIQSNANSISPKRNQTNILSWVVLLSVEVIFILDETKKF